MSSIRRIQWICFLHFLGRTPLLIHILEAHISPAILAVPPRVFTSPAVPAVAHIVHYLRTRPRSGDVLRTNSSHLSPKQMAPDAGLRLGRPTCAPSNLSPAFSKYIKTLDGCPLSAVGVGVGAPPSHPPLLFPFLSWMANAYKWSLSHRSRSSTRALSLLLIPTRRLTSSPTPASSPILSLHDSGGVMRGGGQ
jgi:hypothetical protein